MPRVHEIEQKPGTSPMAVAGLVTAGATAAGVATGAIVNAVSNRNRVAGAVTTPQVVTVAPQTAPFYTAPVYVPPAAPPVHAPAPHGCGYVSDREMSLYQQIAEKDAVIGNQNGKLYTNEYVKDSLVPVYAALEKQRDEICDIKADLKMESERRECGDENLLTYVNGNFIPAEKTLSSRHINYHGVRPRLRLNDCCGNDRGRRRDWDDSDDTDNTPQG